MNDKDKEAVRQQQAAKPKRTSAKNNQKSSGQTDNGQGTSDIQQALQQKAQETGLKLADNFQAAALMYAMQFIGSGQYGEKTTELIEAFTMGDLFPLDELTLVLEPTKVEQEMLPPSLESNGSSTLLSSEPVETVA